MQSLSNLLPILAPIQTHGLRELLVLFLCPMAFDLGS